LAIRDRRPSAVVDGLGHDIREAMAPDGVTIHWLPRDDNTAVPGRLASETATSSWKLPPDQGR
jgi:hypothetical protein